MRLQFDRQTALRLACMALWAVCLSMRVVAAQDSASLPPDIERLLDADPLPQAVIDPTRRFVLLVHERQLLSLERLAEPAIDVAGRKINPLTAAAHAPLDYYGLTLVDLWAGTDTPILLPRGAIIGYPSWSPDGSRFAFTVTRASRGELWIGEPGEARARPLLSSVDASRGLPCVWAADSRRLLCRRRSPRQARSEALQSELQGLQPQSVGQPAVLSASLTKDLLESQLELVDSVSGQRRLIGRPAALESVSAAPAGAFLLVTRIAEPYPQVSGVDTVHRVQEVWDRFGKVRARLPTDARAAGWDAGQAATLAWVEQRDGVDRLMRLPPPYEDGPFEAFRLPHQFGGLRWLAEGGAALVSDYDQETGRTALWLVPLNEPDAPPRQLTSYPSASPRSPLMHTNRSGQRAVLEYDSGFYLRGEERVGDARRSVLEHVALADGERARVWTGRGDGHETVVDLLASDASRLLTHRENQNSPPNYFVTSGSQAWPLTHHADAAPPLQGARRVRLEYLRDDGLELASSLYLPPGYDGRSRLPLILWAYPRRVSPGGTTRIVPASARFLTFERAFRLFFLLHGYAVLDDVSMPVVGDDSDANDTFIEQIIGNAEAAIAAAGTTGMIDTQRVGVAGHSYGAFMVANLLAHSELFGAGVALSGAYNRTLTPFGFQTERRTLWEAQDTYLAMSPLLFSHRIAAPVLLVHGLNDANAGTSPLQSTQFYAAIQGNGGQAELLLLPWEGHTYRARESVFKTAAGMLRWFDRHLITAAGPEQEKTGALLRPSN